MEKKFFKVGQEVWYMGKIKGKVTSVEKGSFSYPIICDFGEFGRYTFTPEGKKQEDDLCISLYQKSFELPENEVIFVERAAYFWDAWAGGWVYDVMIDLRKDGFALRKGGGGQYSKWQYEQPNLD